MATVILLLATTLGARDEFGYDGDVSIDARHDSHVSKLDTASVSDAAGVINTNDDDPYAPSGTGGGASIPADRLLPTTAADTAARSSAHQLRPISVTPVSSSSSAVAAAVIPAQSIKSTAKQPPVILSWECQPEGYGRLKINDTSFGPDVPTELLAELDAAYKLCDRGCVEVHLPLINKDVPVGTEVQRLPYLQGSLQLVFQKLTSPEKEVSYFYNGEPVRRYLITCSDKNTRNDATCAEYWLDGESLGCWPDALKKLQQVKWQRYAVADVTVDFTHPLNSNGEGFQGLPMELQKLLNEHDVAANIHVRYRTDMGR